MIARRHHHHHHHPVLLRLPFVPLRTVTTLIDTRPDRLILVVLAPSTTRPAIVSSFHPRITILTPHPRVPPHVLAPPIRSLTSRSHRSEVHTSSATLALTHPNVALIRRTPSLRQQRSFVHTRTTITSCPCRPTGAKPRASVALISTRFRHGSARATSASALGAQCVPSRARLRLILIRRDRALDRSSVLSHCSGFLRDLPSHG